MSRKEPGSGAVIRQLNSADSGFDAALEKLLGYEPESNAAVWQQVSDIISQLRQGGDAALLDLTSKLDRWQPDSVADLRVTEEQLSAAEQVITSAQKDALQHAADRIRMYHEQQKQQSWQLEEPDGTRLGQQIRGLDSAGIYVPGGKASYPSSVLMNALPAKVAGVERITMCVPAPEGKVMPLVLAAAKLAGVDEVWKIGGAQAIAALAYGTESIERVDKIVGPGNIYVATAKQQVFGQVGLDMLAGPSEILIITDGSANPDWLALDMFAQAEHDEMAQSILLCPDQKTIEAVAESIERLLPDMQRKDIIGRSLQDRGALIRVDDLEQAVRVANKIAPEHLELAVEQPEELISGIRHAGAIFMGHHSPEAFGDYCAGTNHVLPTSGAARFSSPLGVYDFQKRSSLIYCSPAGASELAATASELAYGEGLEAHALSALARRAQTD